MPKKQKEMTEAHWSSPNGCHEDCPACAQETSSVGVSSTAKLVRQVLNKLPKHWMLSDEENIVLRLSGVHADALVCALGEWLDEQGS